MIDLRADEGGSPYTLRYVALFRNKEDIWDMVVIETCALVKLI